MRKRLELVSALVLVGIVAVLFLFLREEPGEQEVRKQERGEVFFERYMGVVEWEGHQWVYNYLHDEVSHHPGCRCLKKD